MVEVNKSGSQKAPIRVLHLITWLNRGGAETWLMSMLREIPRDVCAMDVCCKGSRVGDLAEEARDLGSTVLHCPLDIAHIRFCRGLTEILRNGNYDLVHNHLNAYSGFPVWVAHRAGVPVITTFHGLNVDAEDVRLQRPFLRQLRNAYGFASIRYAVRKSDMVTAVSAAVLRKFGGEKSHDSRKYAIVSLGVRIPEPSTDADRSSFRASLGWPPETPVVLHVGAFKEAKNHRTVVKVFKRVLETLPQARLILIGSGHLRPDIELLVKQLEIMHAVKFLGSRGDIPDVMTRCDVLLFPSLFEGFPLVALEANAAGLPVVGSKIPGLDEAIQDRVTGILHDVNDVEGMADSVKQILSDPEYSFRLGQAGRENVKRTFSVNASARGLLSLYRQCLGIPSRLSQHSDGGLGPVT